MQRAAAQTGGAPDTADIIVVIGIREQAQTQVQALSPVEISSREMVRSTVISSLDAFLAQLVPSFDARRLPASDGPQFVRPASLDGLTPDMILVLVNDRCFRRSAFLEENGAQAADPQRISAFDVIAGRACQQHRVARAAGQVAAGILPHLGAVAAGATELDVDVGPVPARWSNASP